MGDPLALVILALLLIQGLAYLIGGIASARRRTFDTDTAQQLRRELSAWGIIERKTPTRAPGMPDLLRGWAAISARSRIGMGLGILLASGAALALATLLTATPQSSIIPPFVLVVTLFLQAFSLGMFLGNALGLLIGASRTPRHPSRLEGGGTNTAPTCSAGFQPAGAGQGTCTVGGSPAGVAWGVPRIALLPGALLLIDLLLVGGLNLLYLTTFTQAELWSLGIFPAVMLLICLSGLWFIYHLTRRPPPRLSSDPALAARADRRTRARMIGMLLETQVYSLFILVICQWLMQAFASAHPGGVIYNGSLLVYAVVIFSLRGLLERAQREAANG